MVVVPLDGLEVVDATAAGVVLVELEEVVELEVPEVECGVGVGLAVV